MNAGVQADKNWKLVVECLSPTARKIEVPVSIQRAARMECDGFGSLKHCGLDSVQVKDLLWDWSHVRDSSPSALNAAAEVLRSHLRSL